MDAKDNNDFSRFYPDVQEAGDVGKAIMGSDDFLLNPVPNPPRLAKSYATFALARRQVTISCALGKRLFILQFWHSGVVCARVGVAELNELRLMVKAWLLDTVNLSTLKTSHSNIEVLPRGLAFEAGLAVDYEWKEYLNSQDANFAPLIEAASKQPLLRQLFPMRSMNTFRFSRVTGHPPTRDLPYFEVLRDRVYAARGPSSELMVHGSLLFEGDLDDAVAALVRVLPADISPAIDGTADGLKR